MIKTAHATWIQRVSWDIEKSVLDRKHSKHSKKDVYADDLSAEYKIKVRKEVEDKFRVHGEIRIPLAPFRIYGDRGRIRIEDEITLDGYYGVIHPKISCPGSSGDAHYVPRTVAYQGTLVCKYVAYLPKASHGVNRVKVWIGERKRPLRARAAFWFDKSPDKTLGPRQVWVKDSMDPHSPRGPFNRHTHFTYGKQFSCKDAGKQVNTAFLVVPRKHHDRRVQTYGKNDAYRVIDQDSATVHLSCDAKKDPPKCDPSTKGKAPACDPPKKDDPPKSDPPKKDPYPVKVDPTPKQEVIVCAPIKKRDYWTMIGPRGKKTPFFDSGYTYAQIIKKGKRSKNPHYQMARAYVNTMLYIKGGAKYGKKVERSMHWADRYFAAYDPRDSIAKRSPNAHQAKKLRKAIYTKKRVFNRYSKRGNFTRCHAT